MAPRPIRHRGGQHVHRALREAPDTAELVEAARADFRSRHSDLVLPPLVVVIAAYNEAANIAEVVGEIPDRIGGLVTTTLVVDDGSQDETAAVAGEHGAVVCRLPVNRGHGVALRLGYRIAREGGAAYVATLDGDGQWDPADLPAMVELLIGDRADFVIGSRQLGSTRDRDRFRNAGVRFFAWLISLLTRTRLTDTSSGLRAMRAELTGTVRQVQPQYQTSELLIGAVFAGYRVAEVPTVMRPRLSGESKKGHNLLYAFRYAWVILSTWRRERRHPVRPNQPVR